MFGEGFWGAFRFVVVFTLAVVGITMCCDKANAFEKKYPIPVEALMTDGKADMQKCLFAEVVTQLDFIKSHCHCMGEIQYKAERIGDILYITYRCDCKEVSCESNLLHKVPKKVRLPQIRSG